MNKFKGLVAALATTIAVGSFAGCAQSANVEEKYDKLVTTVDNAAAKDLNGNGITSRITGIEYIKNSDTDTSIITENVTNGQNTTGKITINVDSEDEKAAQQKLVATAEKIYDTKNEKDLIKYLDELHKFVNKYMTAGNFTVETNYEEVEDAIELTTVPFNIVVNKVIQFYTENSDYLKIQDLLKKTEQASFTNYLSLSEDGKSGKVYARFGTHSFSMNILIDTKEANYSQQEIIDAVISFLSNTTNNSNISVSFEANSEAWTVSNERTLWENIRYSANALNNIPVADPTI